MSTAIDVISAIRNNDISTVREMIERNQLRASLPLGSEGEFPLSFALSPGQREMAEILVDAGADVDTRCGSMRALGWAVRSRDLELTRLLCERGAEVEGPLSDDGLTALGLAVLADNVSEDILRLLLRFRCSPDRPFPLNGQYTTPRNLARERRKYIALAVFDELAPEVEQEQHQRQQPMVDEEDDDDEPKLAIRKSAKLAVNGAEKRRPGTHWSVEDFNDLADILAVFEDGSKDFSMHYVYESLPQHGRVTIQKHLNRAMAQECGVEQTGERLTSADWANVIARIRQTGIEKVGGRGGKRAKTKDQEFEKAGKRIVNKAPKAAKGGPKAAKTAPATNNSIRTTIAPVKALAPLRELSFRPLEGFVWFPGEAILFAPPQPLAIVTPAPASVARPVLPTVVNDEARMQTILKELQARKT